MSQNFRASYTETLGKLETQYCKLMVSARRVRFERCPLLQGVPGTSWPCSSSIPALLGLSQSSLPELMPGSLRSAQETSSFRLRHLQSLHGFVSRATAELIWLNEKEEEELAYDWSDNNPNIAAKKNYFSVSEQPSAAAKRSLPRAEGTEKCLF